MFISDDLIINLLQSFLEFSHFIQLRAVNSHLCQLITCHAQENNRIIKKGTQLIILKGKFKIRGDTLLPFSNSLRKHSINSQQIVEQFNAKGLGKLFKFSNLEFAKTQTQFKDLEKFNNISGLYPQSSYRDYDFAVCCANCKIDLILSSEQGREFNNEEGDEEEDQWMHQRNIVGMVSREYFDLVWHYDFLTGIRVYVDICTIM